MRAAGRGPGASGKCTRALGKAIRQLFPGATESLVSVEGRPPLGAVIPGPSFLSVSTPGADLAIAPYLSRPARPLPMRFPLPGSPIPHDIPLADSYSSLHTASGKSASPSWGSCSAHTDLCATSAPHTALDFPIVLPRWLPWTMRSMKPGS